MTEHLSHHHRDTLEKIFGHPASANVEWRQVLSLLEAVGTVVQEPNGKVKVTLGPETEVLDPPHGKDISRDEVVDLRRMLAQAGLGPEGGAPAADERTRDYGDGRWGEPGGEG
jgi:hypothetical protein